MIKLIQKLIRIPQSIIDEMDRQRTPKGMSRGEAYRYYLARGLGKEELHVTEKEARSNSGRKANVA